MPAHYNLFLFWIYLINSLNGEKLCDIENVPNDTRFKGVRSPMIFPYVFFLEFRGVPAIFPHAP